MYGYGTEVGYGFLSDIIAERVYDKIGVKIDTGEIFVSDGAKCDTGNIGDILSTADRVAVTDPVYPVYVDTNVMAGRAGELMADGCWSNIEYLPCTAENGFVPELPKTNPDIIYLCYPNNPTGTVYTRQELNQIREIVLKHDLYLFSDEVYREFNYGDTPVVSALQLEGLEQNAVVIDSVSKRYDECGIRIGNIATRNEKLRATVMKLCQARLSPPLLGQIVATASIDAPQSYLTESREEYLRRRDFLVNGLNEIPGVYSPLPMGAFYTVVSLPVPDAEEFCKWCLSEFSYNGTTVFMAPAAGFYTIADKPLNQVRMAYVLKLEDLQGALNALRAALEAYPHTIR